eukprot:6213700-Pleurochrysis_carterae.AAC.3
MATVGDAWGHATHTQAHMVYSKFLRARSAPASRVTAYQSPPSRPQWVRPALGAAAALALFSPATAHATSIADSAFVQASSLIFVSEIGDKTFFIATLLAARASKILTFAGASAAGMRTASHQRLLHCVAACLACWATVRLCVASYAFTRTGSMLIRLMPHRRCRGSCAGALAFMTVVSVLIGQIFHAVPPSLTRGARAPYDWPALSSREARRGAGAGTERRRRRQ